jgi:outer membrane porin, OprD family
VSEYKHLRTGVTARAVLLGALLGAFSSVGRAAVPAQEAPGQATNPTSTSTNETADTESTSSADSIDGVPIPNSTEQGRTTMDQSFEPMTRAQWLAETRRQAFRDTKFYGELRSFYLDWHRLNGTESEAWALGGSAGFKTGYFRKRFAIGATGYTSQRLYGPEDKDGTRLLAPGQHGYTVLGELYSEILLAEGVQAIVGLKGYDTPYLGRFDTRMTPNTFEGASVVGSLGGKDGAPRWRFALGYVDKIKERDSEDFVSMATAAGAPAGVSRGVSVLGGDYSSGNLSLGAIDYYSSDIINIAYTELKDAFALTERLRLQLAAQYTSQNSVGENLLTGGHPFSTEQLGFKVELAFSGTLLTTAYTHTGNGADIRSPWNGSPGYTSVQIDDFDRSGEDAWMVRAAYNFRLVRNLSAYALYVHGSQPEAPNQYARDESDLNLQWKATSGRLRGLSLRARYGHVSQSGPFAAHADQLRLILYYDPPRL